MAINLEQPTQSAAPLADSGVIRRQLLWIAAVAALGALVWGALWWGQDTGWGNPDRAVATKMEQGEKDFVSGRMEDAVVQYRAIVDRYPSNPKAPQAMTQLASVLQQLGNLHQALAVLEKLNASLKGQAGRSDLQAYTVLQIGQVKRSLSDYAGALAAYQEVRTEHPGTDWSGEAQSGIGDVLKAQGNYSQARQAYARLIKELPGGFLAAEAQTAIGQCFEAEKNPKAALRAYRVVLKKYPPAVWDTAQARVDALKKELENSDASSSRG